jgi:lysophospholipase L1-like esterase
VVVVLLSAGSGSSTYYVSLGDSLSVGIQPNAQGDQLITHQGYVNDLYVHYRSQIPQLVLKEMGCPGDDTANVISGQGNAAAAAAFHCDRKDGSQLNAAVAFIRAHRSAVKLITVDIGANDINDCLNPTVYAKGLGDAISCINQGEQSIATNLPKILDALKRVAAPGTTLVGGDIYDPFLGGLLVNNTLVANVANQSLALITKINSEIAYADANAGFKTADVADAFFTYSTTKVRAPSLGGAANRDLVVLCSYTYVCTKAPQGPNVHPDAAGYRAMAGAFEGVVGKL